MAELWKKQTTQWMLNGKRVKPRTPGAAKKIVESRKWYGTVAGVATPLTRDKGTSATLLRKLQTDAIMASHGVCDPYAAHKARPLVDHLADYGAFLRSKGGTEKHVALTLSRCKVIFAKCKTTADLQAEAITEALRSLRASAGAIEIPDCEAFTPRDAARLLGITVRGCHANIARHNLAATGKGKKRRYPRSTVVALAEIQAKGVSAETTNHHLRAVRAFCRWMVRVAKRMRDNPAEGLELLNTTTDRRHDRRELSADEMSRLFKAAGASTRTFRGLDGPARRACYLCACGTGFRASAVAHLTAGAFHLDRTPPVIVLSARLAKNRKVKEQPLPAEVAAELATFLAGKLLHERLWPGAWPLDAAEMIRADLGEAGIPYEVAGPDGPLFADFHSLRHSYLTLLGRSGVDLRTAQELAGHSTPVLTARYSHRNLDDLAKAVGKLPRLG